MWVNYLEPQASVEFILCGIAALLGTSLLSLSIQRCHCANGVVYGLSLAIMLASAAIALRQMLIGDATPLVLQLPIGLPGLSSHFRLDLLSSFFLLIVNFIGAMASLYGLHYGQHEKEPMRILPFFPLFIAGMSLVTIANDAFIFIVAWEMMSLASWLLVMSTHKESGTSYAAYVYLIMAAIGTIALLLAFGLFAGSPGDYTFDAMRAQHLSPLLASAVLFLVLFGAGMKAGLIPLHAWLPLAHPAAPSHVSGLMSGVMTKVALYGIIRVIFDLLGGAEWWWGGIITMIGGITAIGGILYAMMQSDLKKLLAYSTVENVGIITIGLGLSLVFQADHMPVLAGLALTAALFHTLNHALYKSLMFFGAGGVLSATGTRDMEKLGGLIHRMPVTSFVFLIGAMAISALPPLNGFISEWLTFQTILNGPELPQWAIKFSLPVTGAMLAMAAAFTAVCFVKLYGIVFLGRARSTEAEHAHEVGGFMLAAMSILATLCIIIGVLPSGVLQLLRPVVTGLLSDAAAPLQNSDWLILRPNEASGSSYSGLIILGAVAAMTIVVVFVIHQFASNRMRRSAIWDCGFPNTQTDTQYTASSFSQPIRRIFGSVVFSANETVVMPDPAELRAARFSVYLRDHIWNTLYMPVARRVMAWAEKFNRLQSLTIRHYLSLMFTVLVLFLVIVAVIQ